MQLDLARPFHTHSAWRFVVTEGPSVQGCGDNDAPGVLALCLCRGPAEPCLSDPVGSPLLLIVAEPADRLPFGYWMSVERRAPAGPYHRVLRYLSVKRYGDGNPLPAVDSEVPSIERRLGLWKAGDPVPTSE